MDDQDFDALAQRLGALPSRRRVVCALGATAVLGLSGRALWSASNAQARKHKRHHGCRRLPSGSDCSDASQCCSGTCDFNTAYPQFDKVCCRVQGQSCRFGLDECCGALSCDGGICGGGGGACSAGSGAHGEVIDCG
jgi:hypothetical protein